MISYIYIYNCPTIIYQSYIPLSHIFELNYVKLTSYSKIFPSFGDSPYLGHLGPGGGREAGQAAARMGHHRYHPGALFGRSSALNGTRKKTEPCPDANHGAGIFTYITG